MSFNAAFLSPTQSPAAREREIQEAQAEERAHAARAYYRMANLMVVVAFILIVIPQLGFDAPFLRMAGMAEHVVGSVAIVVTVLALLMIVNRKVGKGVLSLLFAWIILPAWVVLAPTVTHVAGQQSEVIKNEWMKKVGKPSIVH